MQGGLYTLDATISLAITSSLPVKHDLIVGGGWGPSTRQRDAPDTSGRPTSFSVEGRGRRALPRSSYVACPSLMRAVCVQHFNGRQPSDLTFRLWNESPPSEGVHRVIHVHTVE